MPSLKKLRAEIEYCLDDLESIRSMDSNEVCDKWNVDSPDEIVDIIIEEATGFIQDYRKELIK